MTLARSTAAGRILVLWTTVLALVFSVGATAEQVIDRGDALSILVLRHPELSVQETVVTDDGNIYLPVVGELHVAGMTVPRATEEVTRRLRERLVHPEVTISFIRVKPDNVYVLGRVAAPGVYALEPGMRVTELLALAGGLTTDAGNTDGVLIRADGSQVNVDIAAATANGDSADNLALAPGDVLNVNERTVVVTITGAVLQPGTYSVPREAGFVEVLARAGGALPLARLNSVVVEHADGARATYDLLAAVLEGAPAPDVSFTDGDLITVPRESGTVSVFGAVATPGTFPFTVGREMRVSDAIALAGGVGPRPDRVAGKLFRRSGEVIDLDMKGILMEGAPGANLVLQDGDMISVMGRTIKVQVLGQVRTPGAFQVTADAGVLHAIATAGGATERACLTNVSVRHMDGTTETVDVLAAFSGEGDVRDAALREGDVVVVREETAAVAVLGAVTNPGYFHIDPNDPPTVTQILAQAGGVTDRARLTVVGVVRGSMSNPERIRVNVGRVLRKGDLSEDLVLQPRDVVYVPDKGLDWDTVFRALSTVALLGRWLMD
ncbi:MAG: SLBB domain-containing protein [Armatimonadetes bacterium]|nr:SLBB domain-containing protein [Armatimonadota bacterium]